MTGDKATFCVGPENGDHISVTILNRCHPECADYLDGNWVNATVEIRAGSFQGTYAAQLRSDELDHFKTELAQLDKTLKGTAEFRSIEGWLGIRLEGNARGHLWAHCIAKDEPGVGNTLTFSLDLDQTFIAPLLRGLSRVLEQFPVVGK